LQLLDDRRRPPALLADLLVVDRLARVDMSLHERREPRKELSGPGRRCEDHGHPTPSGLGPREDLYPKPTADPQESVFFAGGRFLTPSIRSIAANCPIPARSSLTEGAPDGKLPPGGGRVEPPRTRAGVNSSLFDITTWRFRNV